MRDRIVEAGSITVPLLQLRSHTATSPDSSAVLFEKPATIEEKPQRPRLAKQVPLEAEEDYDEDDAKEDEGKGEALTQMSYPDELDRHPYVVTRFVTITGTSCGRALTARRVNAGHSSASSMTNQRTRCLPSTSATTSSKLPPLVSPHRLSTEVSMLTPLPDSVRPRSTRPAAGSPQSPVLLS
jgi:hypothetical protein